ncbi:Predicted protein [Natronincola peptidivorans]|uniref:Phosphodiester glycosidase domain-containing protein n=1 Tax=Natronincola peptidivorans TaxID=426128 RepID=A0A1I0BHH5_9FIRM|nr:phosphodiester glycosidase family protein [Natronincola peptidivorans]SET05987.1 Predicted protein [Natronincola peptidivorans]
MKRLTKAVSAIGLVTVMLSSTISYTFAVDSIAYEKINKEVITTGVTHKNILRFHKDGWLNANVVYIDLDNQGIELDLLQSSNGLATKETLSTMVGQKDNVVAAINGDFFYNTTPDSPLGAMIKDGQIISSPIFVHDFATLAIDQNNQASASYWNYEIFATTDKAVVVPITTINKYTHEYQSIMMIDKNWSAKTPGFNGSHYDMVEVIVIEDEVVEVRRKQPSIDIPENGYVILASQGNGQVLFDSFNVGDRVTIHTNITPNSLDNIKLALGGGTLLVKDGQTANFTQSVTGNHPRTAVGITKDRNQLIMVTIDGRHNSFTGVDGRRLANLMVELGSYEAIIMDGGGSTTMMTRGLGEFSPQITNHPSDGGERRITNGLAVIGQESIGELRGIKAEVTHNKGFIGASREIKVRAFDINNNPLSVDPSQLRFTVKNGGGTFTNNRFFPAESGKNVIEVDYLGKKTEITIDVLDELALLKITPQQLRLNNGQSARLQVVGVDRNGYSAVIDLQDITWRDEAGLGVFNHGVYTAGNKEGITTITASFGNKTISIPAAIGQMKISLGALENYTFKYNSYPTDLVPGEVFLDSNGKVGENSIGLAYDFTQTEATRAAYLEFEEGSILLPNQSLKIGVWAYAFEISPVWIRGHIKDAAGTRHTIDFKKGVDWTEWKYLEANIPQNIPGPVELERIYLAETNGNNKTTGKILFDGIDAMQALELEEVPQAQRLVDDLNTAYTTKGTQFFVHSGITFNGQEKGIQDAVTQRVQELINSRYHLSIFTSSVSEGITSGIEKPSMMGASSYGMKEYDNNLIIQLNNRGGGLRQADFNQWSWLKNLLNTSDKKNIFVILPRPVTGTNGFVDPLEANLFQETLTRTAEQGKNVFVLYGGQQEVGTDIIEGVRYISTGIYSNASGKNSQYIEFNVVGDQVTYQIKPLF